MNRKFKVGDRVAISFWGVDTDSYFTPSGLYFSKSMRDKVRGMEAVITTVYNDDRCTYHVDKTVYYFDDYCLESAGRYNFDTDGLEELM